MQVNAISNFNYGTSRMAHREVDSPKPDTTQPQPQKPIEKERTTASLYFTGDHKKHTVRNATIAGLGSLIILAVPPSVKSCEDSVERDYLPANIENVKNEKHHIKDGTCPYCTNHSDVIYIYKTAGTDINDKYEEMLNILSK